MARTNATNFSGGLQFPMANAATDLFKKEDVQTLALAVDGHDHSAGKGLALSAGSIPAGSITSAMIADGTIVAGDIADGTITSAKIADGTIATADLANASVTNAKLASDTARDNLLTNGGFEIWQRGNGPFTIAAFSADRWGIGLDGTDTMSVSRDPSSQDIRSGNCAAVTYTHGNGTGASALYQQLQPNTDMFGIRASTLTFSIRVRTSVANVARAYIYNNGTFVYGTYHSGDGTYQTLSVTATTAALPSTVNVGVSFNNSNATVYIDNACLVVGAQAADYAPLHPADDLARCLRYYEVIGDPGAGDIIVAGIASGAGQNAQATITYKAKKAVAPTLTVVGTWSTANAGPLSTTPSTSAVRITNTSAAAGAFLTYNATAGNCITLEANP